MFTLLVEGDRIHNTTLNRATIPVSYSPYPDLTPILFSRLHMLQCLSVFEHLRYPGLRDTNQSPGHVWKQLQLKTGDTIPMKADPKEKKMPFHNTRVSCTATRVPSVVPVAFS